MVGIQFHPILAKIAGLSNPILPPFPSESFKCCSVTSPGLSFLWIKTAIPLGFPN